MLDNIDPLIVPSLIALGGVALTIAASAFTAWRQSVREHKRWLREERLAAYTLLLNLLHRTRSARTALNSESEVGDELGRRADSMEERVKVFAADFDDVKPSEVARIADMEKQRAELGSENSQAKKDLEDHRERLAAVKKASNAAQASSIDALVPVTVLGPKPVEAAASAVIKVMGTSVEEEWTQAQATLVAAMRRVLKVSARR